MVTFLNKHVETVLFVSLCRGEEESRSTVNSVLFKSLKFNKNRQINKGMSSYIALVAAFIALFHC